MRAELILGGSLVAVEIGAVQGGLQAGALRANPCISPNAKGLFSV
jgi:hypothetical protein